ncbi:MAG TPA: HdeD family acid-resistance protein [Pirellulales bacterium]|jgi:uncharacterized membrane protein HdeD (DUF308 family)|nr:HdeD family acid-resistance protein [Pirellulales bacterium]
MASGQPAMGGLTGDGALRKAWGWFVGLGVLLIILGTFAVGWSVVTTLVSVLFFGWLLVFGGVMQAVHAFWQRAWSGFFFDLLLGILYAVAGGIIVAHPLAGAVELTLLLGLLFVLGGVFRIVMAFAWPFHHRGWLVLNGVITLVLGVMILAQWPGSGFWVIGLFIGIDMIFNGWSLVMLGLAAKKLTA